MCVRIFTVACRYTGIGKIIVPRMQRYTNDMNLEIVLSINFKYLTDIGWQALEV